MIRHKSTPTLVEVDNKILDIEQEIRALAELIKANSEIISSYGAKFVLIEETIGNLKSASHLNTSLETTLKGEPIKHSEESKEEIPIPLAFNSILNGNVTERQEVRENTNVEATQEGAPAISSNSNIIICNDAEFDDEINNATKSSRYFDRFSLPKVLGKFHTSDDSLEHYYLPPDTYSFFACVEYCSTVFLIAVLVLVIQLGTLWIFLTDYVDLSYQKNPIEIPGGMKIGVSIAQMIALLISCFSQDEIRASLNVLQLGYHQHKVQVISSIATKPKWYLSAIIRLLLGIFSLIITFILVVHSSTVRDVMLDFAAVTFVSELDNGTFELAKWGYMGRKAKHQALMIESTPVYDSDSKRKSKRQIPRFASFLLMITIYFGFWTFVKTRQMNGHYLDENIFVRKLIKVLK